MTKIICRNADNFTWKLAKSYHPQFQCVTCLFQRQTDSSG